MISDFVPRSREQATRNANGSLNTRSSASSSPVVKRGTDLPNVQIASMSSSEVDPVALPLGRAKRVLGGVVICSRRAVEAGADAALILIWGLHMGQEYHLRPSEPSVRSTSAGVSKPCRV